MHKLINMSMTYLENEVVWKNGEPTKVARKVPTSQKSLVLTWDTWLKHNSPSPGPLSFFQRGSLSHHFACKFIRYMPIVFSWTVFATEDLERPAICPTMSSSIWQLWHRGLSMAGSSLVRIEIGNVPSCSIIPWTICTYAWNFGGSLNLVLCSR